MPRKRRSLAARQRNRLQLPPQDPADVLAQFAPVVSHWSPGDATPERAQVRLTEAYVRGDLRLYPEGIPGGGVNIAVVRCTRCGKRAALLHHPQQAPCRNTDDMVQFSFWELMRGSKDVCAHKGNLPDPAELRGHLQEARETKRGIALFGDEYPQPHKLAMDQNRSPYTLRVSPG